MLATFAGLLGYWFASYTDFLGLVYISAQFERLMSYPGVPISSIHAPAPLVRCSPHASATGPTTAPNSAIRPIRGASPR